MILLAIPIQAFDKFLCNLRVLFSSCRMRDVEDPRQPCVARSLADVIEAAEADRRDFTVPGEYDDEVMVDADRFTRLYANEHFMLNADAQIPHYFDLERSDVFAFLEKGLAGSFKDYRKDV